MIFVIVSNILVYNAKDALYVKKLQNMYNDVQNLRGKVIEYYMQYGTIPVNKNVEYSLDGKDDLKQVMTTEELQDGKFYVIDLKTLDVLTLNYGRDYENVTEDMTTEQISQLTDIYIINNITQNVFYVEGVSVRGTKYFTNKKKDDTQVDLKYPEGQGVPYFVATSDKVYTKMYGGYSNIKISLKNYNNENTSELDGIYEVRLQDDSKFKINVEDSNGGIITGGQKNENIIDVNIATIPNVNLNSEENVVILVIIKEPIYKEIAMPLRLELPDIVPGYMNDYRKVEFSDVHDTPNEDVFNQMYGGNNNKLEYAKDGSIVLDEDNPILVFDRSERNYDKGYTIYITFKCNTNQNPNDAWGPSTLFAMSMDQTGVSVVNRVCWFGFRNNNFQIYSYRQGNPIQNLDTEYEEDGVLSKDMSAYSNKIVNLQITGEVNGKTSIYINGNLWAQFNSGIGDGRFNQAVIGDLRPQRGIKIKANLYDIAVYNKILNSEEITHNWNYAKNTWNITE